MCNSILDQLRWGGVVFACVVSAAVVSASPAALAAPVQWAVDSSGYWHDPANWTSNPTLPGPADDVTVDRENVAVTVTLSQLLPPPSDTINSLTVNKPLIVSDPTPPAPSPVLSVTNAAQINGPITVNGGTLNLNGTTTQASTSTLTVTGGTLNCGGAAQINGASTVSGGTLNLNGTTTQAGTSALTVSGGTLNLNGTTTQEGTSALSVSSGTLNVNGTTTQGATSTLSATGGTLYFNGATALAGTSTVSSATISGNGPVTLGSGATFNWPYGLMTNTAISGTTTVSAATLGGPPEARLNIIFGGLGSQYTRLARTINNAGTTVLSGSKGLYTTSGGSGPTINNQAGGTFSVQSDVGLTADSDPSPVGGSFNNYGTFLKSGGTGVSTVESNWTFDNKSGGTVQVQSGILSFGGPLSNAGTVDVQTGRTLNLSGGGTSTGTFSVGSGAALNFSGGTRAFNGGTFTNAGTINFSGGTASFDGAVALPGTVNISGALTGSGTLTASSGATLNWVSGRMTNTASTGTTTIAAAATLNIGNPSSQYIRLARTINNAGAMVLSGTRGIYAEPDGSAPTINNQAGATFDVQSDVGLTTYDEITEGSFNNAGTFKKSGGSGISTVDGYWTFSNTGTVQVQSGTLKLAGVTQLPGTTLTGGTWTVGPNSTLNIVTGGNISTNQGIVSLTGLGSTFSRIDTLANNQGSFKILDGRNFTTGGDLSNSGSLTVGLGSTLTIAGNLTMPTAGVLNDDGIAIIQGSGTSTLSGTLNVGLGGPGGLGGVFQKIGSGTLIINGPQNYGQDAVIRFGSGGAPFPERSLFSGTPSTVPEPGTLSLLLLAVVCLLASRRRWKG